MGTCMSKDKKGAEAPVASSALISSPSPCASSLTQKNPEETEQASMATAADTNAPSCSSSHQERLPIPIARPFSSPSPYLSSASSSSRSSSSSSSSSSGESKEISTTDKHVVEIRLPIASPSMFKPSPGSASIAARAMASISIARGEEEGSSRCSGGGIDGEGKVGEAREKDRIGEEDGGKKCRDKEGWKDGCRKDMARVRDECRDGDEEEEDDDDESSGDESSDGEDDDGSSDGDGDGREIPARLKPYASMAPPPLPPSFFISRASFSRDLAAFSRDLAALSSPLRRSPSVNGAHELTISSSLRPASSHTPLRLYNTSKAHRRLEEEEEHSTRSRSLPKRFFYNNNNNNNNSCSINSSNISCKQLSGNSHKHHPSHKRSSSRDHGEKSIPTRKKMMGSSPAAEHAGFSPRLSVRREEASGECRVHARQAAARNGRHHRPHHHHHHHHHHQHHATDDVDVEDDDGNEGDHHHHHHHRLHHRNHRHHPAPPLLLHAPMARSGLHHHQQDHNDDDGVDGEDDDEDDSENYHALKAYSSSNVDPNTSLRRSPFCRSSTAKAADAEESNIYKENWNVTQMMHSSGFPKHNQVKGRAILRERSVNCTSSLVEGGLKAQLKLHNQKLTTKAKLGEGLENKDIVVIENEAYEDCSPNHQKRMQTEDPSLYYTTKPKEICKETPFYKEGSKDRYNENAKERSKERYKEGLKERPKESSADALAMYPGSIHDRIRSIIEALSEMNMESTLLSEMEESDAEMESDIDLFNLHGLSSPKQDMKAQQARNILLKEAAMDAFARPSFYSNICSQEELGSEFESGRKPTGLAALMAMKLTDTEADTLKIRKVLDLLSVAESEMDKDQKMLFYSQLKMALDSVKLAPIMEQSKIRERDEVVENLSGKHITSRANSWPRSLKDPLHPVSILSTSKTELTEMCGLSLDCMMYARNVVKSGKEVLQNDSSMHGMEGVCSTENEEERCKADNDYKQGTVHESESCAIYCRNATDCAVTSVTSNDRNFSPDIRKVRSEDHKSMNGTLKDVALATLSHDACHADSSNTNTKACSNQQEEMGSGEKRCLGEILGSEEADEEDETKLMISEDPRMSMLTVKCEDGASEASSFEFRARSNVSTPRSAPSTPMISTATTPRRVNLANHRLSCDEIAEIWEAFE